MLDLLPCWKMVASTLQTKPSMMNKYFFVRTLSIVPLTLVRDPKPLDEKHPQTFSLPSSVLDFCVYTVEL